jgi:pimeloyl-ACP methyl ester carboxylesterase
MPAVVQAFALIALVLACLTPREAAAASPGDQTAAARCAAMRQGYGRITDAPTQVIAARIVPASGGTPEACQLDGYVSTGISFQLSLPTATWNEKYSQYGCGALCGDVQGLRRACDMLLQRNYACLIHDGGHRSSAVDGKWAYNNLQAKFDWGVRSLHVTAVAGKYLTEAFYGAAPKYSYFIGGSTGGRQALMFAQRFPWDFDGIVGQNAVLEQMGDGMVLIWNVLANLDENRRAILRPDDARTLHAAVLAKCDTLDGLKDGIVGDPDACRFDPGEIACAAGKDTGCLTPAKVAAARKIYGGPRNSKGERLYVSHSTLGSELSWIGPVISQDGGPGAHYEFQNENFRYLAFASDAGPDWDIHKFDWDEDYKRFGVNEPLYAANSPELRPFKAAGGKMVLLQSLSDTSVFPQRAVDYYERMVAYMGGRSQTDDFFRFFTIPGSFHNTGQNQINDVIDSVTVIEEWVEQGKAPDVIIAHGLKDGSKGMAPLVAFPQPADNLISTRPLYPYPLQARYTGRGDPNDAKNFRPVAPRR